MPNHRLTENLRRDLGTLESYAVLIGILIGFGVTRVRKRMGLGVTWSTWVTTVVVVGFILLLMWVTAYKR